MYIEYIKIEQSKETRRKNNRINKRNLLLPLHPKDLLQGPVESYFSRKASNRNAKNLTHSFFNKCRGRRRVCADIQGCDQSSLSERQVCKRVLPPEAYPLYQILTFIGLICIALQCYGPFQFTRWRECDRTD